MSDLTENPAMTERPKIVVADDDKTIRRSLIRLLQTEGYQALEAADGDEALELIRGGVPTARSCWI